jgi:hypothetical protein
MVHPSTSQMTTEEAKRRLLNLEPEPATGSHSSLLDTGFDLLRKYPLAGIAVAGLAGVLLTRSPWLRKTALKSAAGIMASRIL